jgi:hypothetical protein
MRFIKRDPMSSKQGAPATDPAWPMGPTGFAGTWLLAFAGVRISGTPGEDVHGAP